MEPLSARPGPPLRPLTIATFCLYFGFGLTTPVLPLFARTMGAGGALVGLTVAGFGIASFCFDLAGGRLSDRIGVRRAAAGGALIVLFSALLGAAAPNVWVLLLSRFITGAGSAVYVTTAMNILARMTLPERMGRVMGTYQSAILLGAAFGPSAGGALAGVVGAFLAVPLVAVSVTVLRYAREQLLARTQPGATASGGGTASTAVSSGTPARTTPEATSAAAGGTSATRGPTSRAAGSSRPADGQVESTT